MGHAQQVAEVMFAEQQRLVDVFGGVNGGSFREHPWERPGLGGGRACVPEDDEVFERGSCSRTTGPLTPTVPVPSAAVAPDPSP